MVYLVPTLQSNSSSSPSKADVRSGQVISSSLLPRASIDKALPLRILRDIPVREAMHKADGAGSSVPFCVARRAALRCTRTTTPLDLHVKLNDALERATQKSPYSGRLRSLGS